MRHTGERFFLYSIQENLSFVTGFLVSKLVFWEEEEALKFARTEFEYNSSKICNVSSLVAPGKECSPIPIWALSCSFQAVERNRCEVKKEGKVLKLHVRMCGIFLTPSLPPLPFLPWCLLPSNVDITSCLSTYHHYSLNMLFLETSTSCICFLFLMKKEVLCYSRWFTNFFRPGWRTLKT